MPSAILMPPWPKPAWHTLPGEGKSRMRALLAALGDPHMRLPPVVYITGTNGKGSTLTFLKAFLAAAGYRVHAYITPHLTRIHERFIVAGETIGDALLQEALEETRLAVGDLPHSFNEGVTSAGLLAFSRIPADILLLETIIGSPHDATHITDAPLLTLITSISPDHTAVLGPTIADIARSKSNFIKPGVACVSSIQLPEAEAVLRARCEEGGAPFYAYGEAWELEPGEKEWRYGSAQGVRRLPLPALLGTHQLYNAGTAIAALENMHGYRVPESALHAGLRSAFIAARMQRITSGALAAMLAPGWELWLDGAHNIGGACAIAETAKTWKDKPLYLIAGTSKGKDMVGFFTPLAAHAAFVCATYVPAEPSSMEAEETTQAARAAGLGAEAFATPQEALAHLLAHQPPGRVLLCGSLYLANEI